MAAAVSIRAAKQALRRQVKARLHGMSEAEKLRQSTIVSTQLVSSERWESAARVSIFLSMWDEVQTHTVLHAAFARDKQVFVPRYVGPHMGMVRLHNMQDYDRLPLTEWNVKQPPPEDPREDALESGPLDLILMPGLGFTRDGWRLGRGKAYYDIYLQKCEELYGAAPYTVAIVYREQLCETLPVEPHDRRLDQVLFEPDEACKNAARH